jgi:DNA invertase Pin-like site-specific DNA recombinase
VDFGAVDYPSANKAFIQMPSAFAEYERDMKSARIKAALQATKKSGKKIRRLSRQARHA